MQAFRLHGHEKKISPDNTGNHQNSHSPPLSANIRSEL